MKAILFYDGKCNLCRRSIRFIEKNDPNKKIQFSDIHKTKLKKFSISKEACMREIHLQADGKMYRGFFAFRKLCCILHKLWILVPIMYIPGISFLGKYIYRQISEHRI